MDFYRSCAFAEKVKSMGKPIIASYHGQDIRTRGVFTKMDELADINITSEIDLLTSYDKLTHLCLPYDVKQHNPNTSVGDKIRICHASYAFTEKNLYTKCIKNIKKIIKNYRNTHIK